VPHRTASSAVAIALLALTTAGATSSTAVACGEPMMPGSVEIALSGDGEAVSAARVDADGGGRCEFTDPDASPVRVSILYRDASGGVVEGSRVAEADGPVRTEVRVRDLTPSTRAVAFDGPNGADVAEHRLGIPMMSMVTVTFPRSWQVTVPDAPGTTVRVTRGRVEVVSTGLFFQPVTGGERVVSVDAVPGRGRPTVRVLALPVGSDEALGSLEGLLDRDSAAVLAAFLELAADGTDELADGTRELADGVDELSDGTRELADGTIELADGTRELADGVDELSDGTRELADGTRELADGVDELADAFPEIVDGAGELADGTRELADGTREFADGIGELAAVLTLLADGADGLRDGLVDLADGIGELAGGAAGVAGGLDAAVSGAEDLADRIGGLGSSLRDFYETSPPDGLGLDLDDLDPGDEADARVLATLEFVDQLEDLLAPGADELASSLSTLANGLADIAGGLAALDDGMPELVAGATQLAQGLAGVDAGLSALAKGAGELAKGTDKLADGTNTLADGLGEVDEGIGELADGTGELADGTAELADGVDELADGTSELADGTGELADGTAELADGVDELADGTSELADGTAELPDALREILDLADLAGHRAAEMEALLQAGAREARSLVEDEGTLAYVLVSAGSEPPPLPPAGIAAVVAILVAGGIGTWRALRTRREERT
jgi:X-X-X-Leu-X-X-Gly heptad repeat protein